MSVIPYERKKKVVVTRRNSLSSTRKRKGGELKDIDKSRKWDSIGDKRSMGKGKI